MLHVEHFIETLLPGLNAEVVVSKFKTLEEQYFKWNKVYNLSSIRDKDGFWEKHVLDSMCLASYIYKEDGDGAALYDIGSGGGFPGLVLAITLKNTITMVEPVGKKTGFIEHMITRLQLKNAKILKTRYEEIKEIEGGSIIVSRALGNYKELKKHFSKIAPNSKILLMATQAQTKEIGGKIIETPYLQARSENPKLLPGHVLLQI
ncbi:MAG: 16S rRNA (guanine(527)-N(7))-methyltransferase RsmG [Pseudomonadota bacterium]